MKVQTTVLLLCFLSGVFLYSVVHAKPSPALMKELIALEKYLEKKQGSDGADGQNKNQDENTGDNGFENFLDNEETSNGKIKLTDNGQDKTVNENNNNAGGEASNGGKEAPDDNQKPDGAVPPEKPEEGVSLAKPEAGVPPAKPEEGVPPAKPEEGVSPAKPEEGVPPAKPEEGVPPAKPEEGVPPKNAVSAPSGGKEEGEKPQEGNGQVEKGRDQTFAVLDQAIEKIEAALNILKTLGDTFWTEFHNDDRKIKELKDKDEQRNEKLKESLDQTKNTIENIKDIFDLKSAEKKSVRENAPARRSHLSDTEFLNIVHSLLTDN